MGIQILILFSVEIRKGSKTNVKQNTTKADTTKNPVANPNRSGSSNSISKEYAILRLLLLNFIGA